MKRTIVVFDVETTGLDPERDEIIEFGAWRFENGFENDREPKSFQFLAKPRCPVPPKILKLTGIKENELEFARPFHEYVHDVQDFLRDAVIVGHNIRFDLSILSKYLRTELKEEVWDTLHLSRIFFPSLKNYSLNFLVEKLNLNNEKLEYHRALNDSWLTWKLLEQCWKKGLELDLGFYEQVQQLLTGINERAFFEGLKREISRRFPARAIKTGLIIAQPGDGLFQKEDFTSDEMPQTVEWVKDCFAQDGILNNIPNYESRQGQAEMAYEIGKCLCQSKHMVVEAGTGTGKSIAYLLPSLWWAKKNNEKVVVATHTIPLQEQLFEKDLPTLEKILPFRFKAALLKGRNNYLCIKRFQYLLNNPGHLLPEECLTLLTILMWLRETFTGDYQELPQTPELKKIWGLISAEQELCRPARCSATSQCFLLRAKKQADEAQLIIINHSLLFSDIKTDFNVIPDYQYLIVDEAHHFYSTALEHLGVSLSREGLYRLLDMIYHSQGAFYSNTLRKLNHLSIIAPGVEWDKFSFYLTKLPEICQFIREQSQEMFQLLSDVVGESQAFRISGKHKDLSWCHIFLNQLENLIGRIKELKQSFSSMNKVLEQGDEGTLLDDSIDELKLEITGHESTIDKILEALEIICEIDNTERVVWIEKTPWLTLKSSPVDVSPILRTKLFSRLKSTVLTSATLAINNTFDHFLENIGLDNAKGLIVSSPFNYEEQMRFFVVRGFNLVNNELAMVDDLARFIADTAELMQGKTLVLFTSHKLLQATYPVLLKELESMNLELFAQGIAGSRKGVLEGFKNNPKSVLLGAYSFWEGIDIPGDGLSCVILIKLPFWPPSLPVIEARSELLKAQGKSPFHHLMLPEAIMRFKQGFGRLIRTKEDHGVVILLDDRVLDKSYGRLFLSSLPLNAHIRGDREFVLQKIDLWMRERQGRSMSG